MKYNLLASAIILTMVILFSCTLVTENSMARQTRQIPATGSDTWRNRISQNNNEDLMQLKCSIIDDVSIRATWELAKRILSNNKSGKINELQSNEIIHNFLGFAEGRLRVNIPKWWQDELSGAKWNEQGNAYYSGLKSKNIIQLVTTGDYQHCKNWSITNQDNYIVINMNNSTIKLDSELIRKERRLTLSNILNGAQVRGKDMVLAIHPNRAVAYNIHLIDGLAGKPIWSATVHTTGRQLPYEGDGFHIMDIQTSEERIFIFGICDNAAYIEGFRLSDGKSILQFSTCN